MTAVDSQLWSHVNHLSPKERQRLIDEFVDSDRHELGPAEARLCDSGVHIWAIVGYLPAVSGDLGQTAADFDISLDAVMAAVLYYLDNRDLIDWRLQQNRSARV